MQFSTKIIEFSTLENQCSYLSDKRSRMEYKYIENCTSRFNDDLVKRGWRRFGNYYSRPNCATCQECKSLRIDAQAYTFSKSARRVIRKNSKTVYTIQKPTLSNEHLEIYEKYHAHMEAKKGWKSYKIRPNSYYELYIAGAGKFGKEVLYFIDDRLVAVDLIDFMDDGISSIYFYYDPDYADFSLGRYSIYVQIQLAKNFNLRWIYLGYYVKDCISLNYKEHYKPYEILQNNPALDEPDIWK
ncbi:arginyltransferase [Sulfurospirillum sp. 1612]|uniref:arginyltransferase n=1 Tax=Sulfurospirillum sp. 1612 TaxID=3094835 RepID=UPI002F929309